MLATVGCSQLIDPDVPEPIRAFVEPKYGGRYVLYRPSSYDRDLTWPLVVVCHTSFPDSPNRQMRHWTQLAESRGFLVVAPSLKGTKSTLPPKAAKQIALQRDDERRILAAIRHVRAGHNVSDERIFIYGWSGGAYAALYTGLKNPETFRAISLLQPKFNGENLTDVEKWIDPYQPVFVNYSIGDAIIGKHGDHCVDWLRSQRANVQEDSMGPARVSDTRRAVESFEEATRKYAWMHVRAYPASGDNPLAVQFKLRCSYAPTRFRWEFGDGDESPVAEPIHVYPARGSYRVSVTVDDPKGRQDRRTVNVDVPPTQTMSF